MIEVFVSGVIPDTSSTLTVVDLVVVDVSGLIVVSDSVVVSGSVVVSIETVSVVDDISISSSVLLSGISGVVSSCGVWGDVLDVLDVSSYFFFSVVVDFVVPLVVLLVVLSVEVLGFCVHLGPCLMQSS